VFADTFTPLGSTASRTDTLVSSGTAGAKRRTFNKTKTSKSNLNQKQPNNLVHHCDGVFERSVVLKRHSIAVVGNFVAHSTHNCRILEHVINYMCQRRLLQLQHLLLAKVRVVAVVSLPASKKFKTFFFQVTVKQKQKGVSPISSPPELQRPTDSRQQIWRANFAVRRRPICSCCDAPAKFPTLWNAALSSQRQDDVPTAKSKESGVKKTTPRNSCLLSFLCTHPNGPNILTIGNKILSVVSA
jgi:hypothetical protein